MLSFPQEKFEASLASPLPLYFATWPNGHSGRVLSTWPLVECEATIWVGFLPCSTHSSITFTLSKELRAIEPALCGILDHAVLQPIPRIASIQDRLVNHRILAWWNHAAGILVDDDVQRHAGAMGSHRVPRCGAGDDPVEVFRVFLRGCEALPAAPSHSTRSTLMKFVLPATCSGAPPVMITCWPESTYPALRAAAIE